MKEDHTVRCLILSLALVAVPALAQTTAAAKPPQAELSFRAFGDIAMYPRREAPAAVVSLNESRIAAEVAAVIVAMNAEAGQVVDKGAVLARLDARDSSLAVERAAAAEASAKARLGLAEAQLRRARELKEKNFISQEALNQRETEVAVVAADARAARAALATARRNLDKCVIRAPFRAIVRARSGQVGELAGAGTALYTLLDADRLEISAQVPARDAEQLTHVKEIAFVGQDGRHAVSLIRISPAIERAARTREARLRFVGAVVSPGAEGRIEWRDPAAHVPPEYLVRRGTQLGVFVIEAGKARFVPLAEAQEGRPAAAGLKPETRIAAEGRHTLNDGQAVAEKPAEGTRKQ